MLDVRTAHTWLFVNLIIDTDMFVPSCANCNILPQFEQGTQIKNSVSLKTELEHEKVLKNQTTFLNRSLSWIHPDTTDRGSLTLAATTRPHCNILFKVYYKPYTLLRDSQKIKPENRPLSTIWGSQIYLNRQN